jgi:hypothetical protein
MASVLRSQLNLKNKAGPHRASRLLSSGTTTAVGLTANDNMKKGTIMSRTTLSRKDGGHKLANAKIDNTIIGVGTPCGGCWYSVACHYEETANGYELTCIGCGKVMLAATLAITTEVIAA